jgi:hypothetical protein
MIVNIMLTAEQIKLVTVAARNAQTNIGTWIKDRLLTAARAEISNE